MYIGFLLFLIILSLLVNTNKMFIYKIKKSLLLSIIILIFVVIGITIVSFYLDLSFMGIYNKGIFFADGIRYLDEVILFKECPWCLDEYLGQYFDYRRSVKMGLSSLLAWLTFPFNIENINIYYILNNFVFIIISIISLFILKEIFELKQIDGKKQFYFSIFIILLPFDIYWLLRFLREPCANAFFLLFTLLSILMIMKNKNYLFYLFTTLIFLILFRVQLAMLASVTLFILFIVYKQKIRYICISILFIIISFKQMITITGIELLYKYFNQDIVTAVVVFIKYINNDIVLIGMLFIVLSTYIKNKSPKKYNLDLYRLKMLFFINIIIAITLFISLSNMQIRFVYPFIFYFKLLFVFYIIDNKIKFVWKKSNL